MWTFPLYLSFFSFLFHLFEWQHGNRIVTFAASANKIWTKVLFSSQSSVCYLFFSKYVINLWWTSTILFSSQLSDNCCVYLQLENPGKVCFISCHMLFFLSKSNLDDEVKITINCYSGCSSISWRVVTLPSRFASVFSIFSNGVSVSISMFLIFIVVSQFQQLLSSLFLSFLLPMSYTLYIFHSKYYGRICVICTSHIHTKVCEATAKPTHSLTVIWFR